MMEMKAIDTNRTAVSRTTSIVRMVTFPMPDMATGLKRSDPTPTRQTLCQLDVLM